MSTHRVVVQAPDPRGLRAVTVDGVPAGSAWSRRDLRRQLRRAGLPPGMDLEDRASVTRRVGGRHRLARPHGPPTRHDRAPDGRSARLGPPARRREEHRQVRSPAPNSGIDVLISPRDSKGHVSADAESSERYGVDRYDSAVTEIPFATLLDAARSQAP